MKLLLLFFISLPLMASGQLLTITACESSPKLSNAEKLELSSDESIETKHIIETNWYKVSQIKSKYLYTSNRTICSVRFNEYAAGPSVNGKYFSFFLDGDLKTLSLLIFLNAPDNHNDFIYYDCAQEKCLVFSTFDNEPLNYQFTRNYLISAFKIIFDSY